MEAPEGFDVICLARSPDFTPAELDPLFDEIRERFIDEEGFASQAQRRGWPARARRRTIKDELH
jgi:hypothetical protein